MGNKIKFDTKQVADFLGRIGRTIVAQRKFVLLFLALAALAYCGYLWYFFVVHPEWSADKKQAYISATENKIRFDQKKFDAVMAEISRRKSEYNNKLENIPDIFRLK